MLCACERMNKCDREFNSDSVLICSLICFSAKTRIGAIRGRVNMLRLNRLFCFAINQNNRFVQVELQLQLIIIINVIDEPMRAVRLTNSIKVAELHLYECFAQARWLNGYRERYECASSLKFVIALSAIHSTRKFN